MKLHQETIATLKQAVYKLWEEQSQGNFSPLFTVIEEAINLTNEASTNSLHFPKYSDVLDTLEERLDEIDRQGSEILS